MSDHGPWTHGDEIADIYEEWSQSLDSLDTGSAVAALAGLAGEGPVLELAIGTGRLALPLAERGGSGAGSSTRRLDLESVTVVDIAKHDPVGQRVAGRHFVIHEDGIRCVPVQIRYAYPSELDLMARLCGLRLEGNAEHISVYGQDSS